MAFAKAAPQQARLKVSMYGPPGSGKTFTALLFAEGLAKRRGKRIAYVDTERGTDFYAQAVKARRVHPEAFEFDAIYTRSLAVVSEEIYKLDPSVYGVVVIDSWSHLWTAAMEAYEGKMTSIETIPMHAWGKIKKPYRALLDFLMGSMFDVFILGRQKNLFENDEKGDMQKVGVGMRAESETPYEPHVCLRMALTHDGITTLFSEKDRTGILQGRTFSNPDFSTIEPILPFLGDVQAPPEDQVDRVERDGELLDQQETKSRDKEAKSAQLFAELTAEIQAAQTLEQLGVARGKAKKGARSLLKSHVDGLVLMFEAGVKRVSDATVGTL